MRMRKNTLLIATAVAALTVGSGMAFAQGAPEANPAAKVNPAAKSAPAEKIAPASPAIKSGAEERKPMQGAQKAQERNEPAVKGAQKDEKSAPANRMGQTNQSNKSKTETTGQAPTQPAQRAAPKDDKLNSDAAKSNSTQPNNAASPSSTQNRTGGAANVNLTVEQKTKIHQTIIADRSAPRVASVTFKLNVGVAVPRSVRLVAVPSTIIEIQPAWRGFEYFLVGDEIVIVDPATMQIVAIVPA